MTYQTDAKPEEHDRIVLWVTSDGARSLDNMTREELLEVVQTMGAMLRKRDAATAQILDTWDRCREARSRL